MAVLHSCCFYTINGVFQLVFQIEFSGIFSFFGLERHAESALLSIVVFLPKIENSVFASIAIPLPEGGFDDELILRVSMLASTLYCVNNPLYWAVVCVGVWLPLIFGKSQHVNGILFANVHRAPKWDRIHLLRMQTHKSLMHAAARQYLVLKLIMCGSRCDAGCECREYN